MQQTMPPALRDNKRDQRVGNSPQSDDSGWGDKAPRTPSTFGLRAEGSFHLASKPVLLVAIAGREVEGDKSRNARSPCDVTGLPCRKMLPLCGNLRIRVKKRRFDEELIGTACQRDDAVDVLVVIGGVDYIGNLLSPRRAQRMLLEHAEGDGKAMPNNDFAVVWLASPNRALVFIEPRSDAKPERLETPPPHVDAELFLER